MTSSRLKSPNDPGLRSAFAGAVATFSGIGLARFAYVPLFPAMVAAGWVTGAEAGLLGAVNLGGYLLGIVGGRSVARRTGTVRALHLGMGLVLASLAGCSLDAGLGMLVLWRGLAGIAGGGLMVLAGPAVQGAVTPARRGFAGGIVMTGVGAGVIVAALGVPVLLRTGGLPGTWLGLAAVVAALWLLAGRAWPATAVAPDAAPLPAGANVLALAYGISGAGLVPHMVYFGDLVIRGRGFAVTEAATAWLLFGIGGLVGSLLGGRAADRWGAGPSFRLWLLFQVAALALVFLPGEAPLLVAAGLGGFASIGLTSIALGWARELAGPAAGGVWARTTASFALCQAVTGFALAALFAATASHDALFGAGLALSAAALVPTLLPGGRRA